VAPPAHYFLEDSFAFLAFYRTILCFSGGGKSAFTRLAHRLLIQQAGNGAAHEGAHKIIGGAVENLFGSTELCEAAALREDGEWIGGAEGPPPRRTPSGWAPEHDGQAIYLLGTTHDELDGSEWARFKGHLGGLPPKVDLAVERQLGDMLVNMSRDGMIDAAHDVAAGGLAAALAEACLRFNTGARIGLGEVAERDGLDLFTLLFSESLGRVVVSVPRSEEVRFKDMCTARQFPFARIGVVDALSNALDFQNEVSINLDDLRAAHEGTMAAHFGEVAQG